MTIPFARLEIHSNRGASQELLLDRDLVSIGRAPDNTLVLNELAVSRYHARITRETDRYLITDLGSSNGTRVNDAELSPRTPMPLADGDIIRIRRVRVVCGFTAATGHGRAPYADTATPPASL
ncbi:MAG: FHA domain-containing protein [Anaerolineae bacterium]